MMADDTLHLTVVDTGPGGAVVTAGRGLAGMKERLAAFGGTLSVSSPAGGPTTVAARIPLLLQEGEQGVPAPAPLSPTPRPSAVPPH